MDPYLQTDRKLRGAIFTLMVIVAVDVLSILLIIPIVDTFAQSLGASKELIGTQFTVYSASSIFSSLVVGKLSDYYGRKRIFMLSAIGACISATACIFVQDFVQFLAASAFSGLFTGTVGTAYAYVGDLIPDETRRRRYISYITATMALCLVLGPLIGGTVATFYLRAPFFISAGIALLEVFLVIFCLQNPNELTAWKEQLEYNALLSAEDRALLRPERSDTVDEHNLEDSVPAPYHISTVSLDNAVSMKLVGTDLETAYHHEEINPMLTKATSHRKDTLQQTLSAAEILRQVALTAPIAAAETTTPSSSILPPTPPPQFFDHSASFVTVIVEDETLIDDDSLDGTNERKNKAKKRFPYLHASKQAITSLLSPSKSQSHTSAQSTDVESSLSQQPSLGNNQTSHNSNSSRVQRSLFFEGDDDNDDEDNDKSKTKGRTDQTSTSVSSHSQNSMKLIASNETQADANGVEKKTITLEDETPAKSPWLDHRALTIGGLGTFFNMCTYLGLVTLVPLLLQDTRFGVVHKDTGAETHNTDDDGLSGSEIRHISFLMGLYLGCYGATQVLGMLFVYPKLSAPSRCGVLGTAVVGCLIYGGSFCCLPVLTTWYPQYVTDGLFGISICMAFGNALCRPAFPTYLNQIAPSARRAEYMALSATFSNLAMVIGGQMTWLYAWQSTATIFLCGAASLFNAALIGLYILCCLGKDKAQD